MSQTSGSGPNHAGSPAASGARGRRKVLQGRVVSDKMLKTITVSVERILKHPKYKKYVRRKNRYHAHDEGREAREGDLVEIMECRPLSKIKRWRLIRVVERAELPAGGGL